MDIPRIALYFFYNLFSTLQCIDFRSNDDVQMILQDSNIYIDSIQYPAVAYEPLVRIDRCFRCQQFGDKSTNCSNEPKCYKCGEPHDYRKICLNAVKCANCSGQHMAGAPEYPVKISYRKDQRHNSTGKINESSLIIETIKEEINRSQNILMERIMQLELKCEAAQEQQKTLHKAIDNQILPYMTTVSELFINVCQQLIANKVIELSDQHLEKLSHLYPSTNTTNTSPMNSFSDLPPVFTFVPSSPPLMDTLSSDRQHSSSFFQLSFRPNANSFFINSNRSSQ